MTHTRTRARILIFIYSLLIIYQVYLSKDIAFIKKKKRIKTGKKLLFIMKL